MSRKNDKNKTKEQLTKELTELRQQIAELEQAKNERAKALGGRSEGNLREVIDCVKDGIVIFDLTSTVTTINKRVTEVAGYTEEDIIGKRLTRLKMFPPKSIVTLFTAFTYVVSGQQPLPYEVDVYSKTGEKLVVEIHSSLLRKGEEKVGVVAVLRDITERKQLEALLLRERETFVTILQHALYGVALLDKAGKYLYVNHAFTAITGYTLEDIPTGRDWMLKAYPDEAYRKEVTALWRKDRGVGGKSREISVVCKNGETKEIEFRPTILDDGRAVVMFSDITERKRAEKALQSHREHLEELITERTAALQEANAQLQQEVAERKLAEEALQDSEERLKILFEFAPDAYYVNDLKGTFIDGNRAAEGISGYKKEQLIGKSFLKLKLLPKNQIPWAAALLAQNALGKTTGPDEFTLNRKDGSQVPLEIRTYPIKIHGQTLVLGIARDITERKQKENALRESEENYRSLVESSEDSIYLIDSTCHYLFVNSKYLSRLGERSSHVIGKGYSEFHSPEASKDFSQRVKTVVKTGTAQSYEYWSQRDNRYFIRTLSPVTSPNSGKINAITVISKDITERKQAEERLKESEERFRAIFEASQDLIFIKDRDLKFTVVNPAMERYFGVSASELVGKTTASLFGRGTSERSMEEEDVRVLGGEVIDAEHSLQVQGNIVIQNVVKMPMRNITGEIIGICGTARDITERKQMEEDLRKSEERFKMLAENAPYGITIMAPNRGFEYLNPQFTKIFGYTIEDMPDKDTWFKKAYPDKAYRDKVISIWKRDIAEELRIGEENPRVFTVRCKDGQDKIIDFRRVDLIDGKQYQVYEDVTARAKAEEVLRESEKKYRELINGMDDTAWVIDFDGKFIDVNDAAVEVLGYSREELLTMGPHDIDSSLDAENITGLIKRMRTDKLQVFETTHTTKDGKTIPVEIKSSLVTYQGKQTILSIARDITERKKAEEAVRESESRFRLLVEHSIDSFILHDFDGKIMDVNQYSCDTLGYTREELLGLSVQDIDPRIVIDKHKEKWKKMVPGEPLTLEGVNRRKDGTIFPVEIRLVAFESGGRRLILGLSRNISERKRAEETIRKLAYHDALTGLPNRVLFVDRLKHAIAQERRKQNKLAVMLLDLDHFKNINDTLGHSVGDQLLSSVGKRLTRLLRKEDTVSRMGGDEFFLLLPEIDGVQDAATIAQKVLNTFQEESFVLDDHDVNITTSIGVAIYPDDGKAVKTLLRNADVALYQAKQKGRNNYQHYTQAMDPESQADE